MSYRIQVTALSGRQARTIPNVDQLKNLLAVSLADDAEEAIDILRHYPGEAHNFYGSRVQRLIHARYVKTGYLQSRTLQGFETTFSKHSRTILGVTARTPDSREYKRTGLLGMSWGFDIKYPGDAVTLQLTNTAHDRPGNYYAGWVHGLNQPGANAKYHQSEYNANAEWPTIQQAFEDVHVKENAQAVIDEYLASLGLVVS